MADSSSSTTDNPNIDSTLALRRQRRSTSNPFYQQQQSSSSTTTRKSSTVDNVSISKSMIKSDSNISKDCDDDFKNETAIPEQLQQNCRWSLTEPLEACDIQGNWYPAKIVEIKNDKIKIHFLRWK